MFVITFTDLTAGSITNLKTKYMGIDYASGGYPYWSDHMSRAKLFLLQEEAATFLLSEDFTRNVSYGEYMGPPRMIYSGLDLCDTKEFGRGIVQIMQIVLQEVFTKAGHARRDKPVPMEKMLSLEEAREWAKFTGSITAVSSGGRGGRYFFVDSPTYILKSEFSEFRSWTPITYTIPMVTGFGMRISSIDHLIDVFYKDETLISP